MKRLHLFEFNDLSWWPSPWKNMETDYLSMANRLLNLYAPAIERLGRILERLHCRHLVDLCSGGARHWAPILRRIDTRGLDGVRVTLTDIEPNTTAYREARNEDPRIGYVETPVDATRVPPHLNGLRTMFAGLHHFGPDGAARILRDAARHGKGIAVLEHTYRSPGGILSMIPTPLLVWLLTPFIRPMTFGRFFWTYLVPVIPLTILWDGLVSAWRSYTVEELNALVRPLHRDDYRWEINVFRTCGLLTVTLLVGYPVDPSWPDTRMEPDAVHEAGVESDHPSPALERLPLPQRAQPV
jgi:hypothetical protein